VDGLNGDYRGYERIKQLAAALGQANGTRGRPKPVAELLAMSRNRDPYYAGQPAQREKAVWFAELWQRLQLPRGVHLRRIHYRLVSRKRGQPRPVKHDGTPYENTELCWEYLQEAGAMARYLKLVPADAFEDHRNPPPKLFMHASGPHGAPAVELEELDWWSLPRIRTDLTTDLWFPLPGIEAVYGYEYDAGDQPYHVEIWIEKSTMDEVLEPVCRRLHVNLITGEGFQSITNVVKLLQRVCALGKPARIFVISDFDPAGDSMPVAIARQAEFWLPAFAAGADVKVTALALTREQVKAYRLPPIPIKDSDTRKAGFEERYGEGAVELDALEAVRPGALGRLVRDAIAPYRDPTLEDRLAEAEAEARDRAGEAWRDRIAPYREELGAIRQEAREIVGHYEGRLEELDEALQADLAPLRERLEAVRRAVQEEIDQFAVELPERPTPDTDPVDEDDWLFASERDYFTQLAVYKARKNGQGPEGATAE
jgi:hypothetical protein